jgi:hexosaminidase
MIPHIIPQPVCVEPKPGSFTLLPDAVIAAQDEAVETALLLSQWLGKPSGYSLPVQPLISSGQAGIRLEIDLALGSLGREGYQLEVSPAGVRLRAPAAAGLFYAAQTLRQLFPPAIFAARRAARVETWQIPAVWIEDRPRFGWRGAMLDVSRHFMPVAFVERFIDLMALHKLNVFHWHLTDDQGWRIEIKKYPRLTEVGAWRSETLVGRLTRDRSDLAYDGVPHGGFYTQAEIRRVVAYARRRHVRVVPEIEVPGHAQAAIAAYPELGCNGPQQVARHWGIFTYDVFNPFESTFEFLKNVFDEVADLFPGEFIHIGGDEVRKQAWIENADVQACKQALGLADEHALQSYFIRRMEAVLQSRGRRLVGWDEILEGGLAPSATVMSWRGEAGGIAAAQAGHSVVMAPNTYTYFDYYQSSEAEREPLAIGGCLPLSRVYSYNPIPTELTAEQAACVLGTQFQLWSEYLPNPQAVEYMAFPRACALAEAAWSPQEVREWNSFTARLATHLQRLDRLNVNYRKGAWE